MKTTPVLLLLASLALPAAGDDKALAEKIARHQDGSLQLAEKQDELAADVQQLAIEQTHPKLIELLVAVEEAMDEASARLADLDTRGETIAAQTDIIEKILAAAEEKQRQSGSGESGSAMLDMMQRMMGREPAAGQPGGQQGEGTGDQGGEGRTGDSGTANTSNSGAGAGKAEPRRVPKASGTSGQSLPREFHDALDAYNRAAGKLAK